MKKVPLLLALAATVCILQFSCKPFPISALQPPQQDNISLPRLLPVTENYPEPFQNYWVNYHRFEPDTMIQPVLVAPPPPAIDSSRVRIIRNSYAQNANADEMIVYFARSVNNNFSSRLGVEHGYISCNVTAFENQDRSGPLILLNGLTLFIPSILGLPVLNQGVQLEIEVQVRDCEQRILAVYQGQGDARMVSGMYYGYQMNAAYRLIKLRAMQKAMDQVKAQIIKDKALLEKQLYPCR